MPSKIILPKFARLLALPLALSLTACGPERPRLVLPPAARAEQVATPAVPVGEATCEGEPCLSDREIGGLLAALKGALDEANRKLGWLHDWIVTAGR